MTRPDEIAALADRLELHTKELANQPLCMTMSDWSQLSNDMLAAAQALRLSATSPGDAVREALDWAVARWHAEVRHRPLKNIHRRSLDDTWRQMIRHLGGDDIALCGPKHDDLVNGDAEYKS